jgi:hypothetical protein
MGLMISYTIVQRYSHDCGTNVLCEVCIGQGIKMVLSKKYTEYGIINSESPFLNKHVARKPPIAASMAARKLEPENENDKNNEHKSDHAKHDSLLIHPGCWTTSKKVCKGVNMRGIAYCQIIFFRVPVALSTEVSAVRSYSKAMNTSRNV